MEKPIIATNLVGLFINSTPWTNAHKLWYEDRAKELNDQSIMEWVGRENYFQGVDIVMKRLFPDLSDSERTKKAREMFFDSVIKYIEQNPSVLNKEVVEYFQSLKNKYQIALITSNTLPAINKILSITDLKSLFDVIEASLENEKDDKTAVFTRFINKYGKPIIYIGGSKKETYDFCNENNVKSVYVNLENKKDIENIESVYNLQELKEKINSLNKDI